MIRDFNAIDTGMFLCGPIMFDALEVKPGQGRRQHLGGDECAGRLGQGAGASISRAASWVDVDDPAAFRKAEELLETGRL